MLERSGSRQDPSRIVIVSSTAGTNVPHVGENGTIMYSVSKAAAHVSFIIARKSFKLISKASGAQSGSGIRSQQYHDKYGGSRLLPKQVSERFD